jgi:hypothetical protein
MLSEKNEGEELAGKQGFEPCRFRAGRLRVVAFLAELDKIPDRPAYSSACRRARPPDLDRLTLVPSHDILLFVMGRIDPEPETGAFTPSSKRNSL